MCYGIGVRDGWEPLLRKLCEDIMALPDLSPEVRFDQIKEKLGRLTVYTNNTDKRANELCVAALKASQSVCEICGTTYDVGLTDTAWKKTLCVDCHFSGRRYRRSWEEDD